MDTELGHNARSGQGPGAVQPGDMGSTPTLSLAGYVASLSEPQSPQTVKYFVNSKMALTIGYVIFYVPLIKKVLLMRLGHDVDYKTHSKFGDVQMQIYAHLRISEIR